MTLRAAQHKGSVSWIQCIRGSKTPASPLHKPGDLNNVWCLSPLMTHQQDDVCSQKDTHRLVSQKNMHCIKSYMDAAAKA